VRNIGRGLAVAAAAVLALGPLGAARVAAADLANDDGYDAFENQVLNVPAPGVLGNDTNDGGPALCVLSASGAGFAFLPDGSFTFTPPSNTVATVSATYDLGQSGAGGTCDGPAVDSAQVNVTIQNVNSPPIVEAASSCSGGITVAEDSGAFSTFDCVNILSFGANDTGQSLAAWVVTTADPDFFSTAPGVTLDDPWALFFTTAPNASGSTTISVKARDTGGTANGGQNLSAALVIGVTITPVNDAPTATNDSFTVLKSRTLNVAGPGILSNDSDVDGDSLTAVKVTDPVHGVVTVAANGGFSYTPTTGYVGADAFSYLASDGSLSSPARVVNLTVTDVPATATPVPTPSPTPAPTPTPEPTVEASPTPLETASAEPSASADPGLSAAPTVAPTAAASPSPRPSAEPEPAGGGGGLSLPVLLAVVLLVVLLAFGAAAVIPKWLESRQAAGPGGPYRPDDRDDPGDDPRG
jgi:hypothetical protein